MEIRTPAFFSKLALWRGAVVLLIAGLAAVLLFQNVRSAFRLYPSGLPGYQVQAFDATPRWAGTRALFFLGISPYSRQGSEIIQTQYFGRPLQSGDEAYIGDQQKFAYPLYVSFLYLPTIGFDFSTALVVLGLFGAVGIVGGTYFWFVAVHFPKDQIGRLGFLALVLTFPVVFSSLQNRQPALWVYLFIAVAAALVLVERPSADAAAGVMLAWSSLKLQSSILVIGYVLFVYYGSTRSLRRLARFLMGLLGMGLFFLVSCELLSPGWLPQFLDSLRDYREYAGTTMAEVIFGPALIPVAGASALAVLVWLGMCVIAFRSANRNLHLVSIGYALVLQTFILPTHTYNFLFAIPLILLACQAIAILWMRRAGWGLVLVGVPLGLVVYLLWFGWIGILREGLPDALRYTLEPALSLVPGRVSALPILAMLLAVALFWMHVRWKGEFARR